LNVTKIVSEVLSTNCPRVEFRILNMSTIDDICSLLSLFEGTVVTQIDLILVYFHTPIDDIKAIFRRYHRLSKIIFSHSPENSYINKFYSTSEIVYSKRNLFEHFSCGNFIEYDFISNINFFSESQKYNNCLNRKLAIDKDGNIKNCLGTSIIYGNLQSDRVAEIVKKNEFRHCWTINKNSIDVCKSCEFRYVCQDCRAYLEKPEDVYSKPLKCGYNPSTCEWNDWRLDPKKKAAIHAYIPTDL